MIQDTIESLKMQEEELEKLMMGAPPEGETKPEGATEEQPIAEEAHDQVDEAVTSPTDSAPDDKVEPEKDTEDWKLRFTNLRSSRDEKLYRAKRELTDALTTIRDLHTQVASLRTAQPAVDPLDGVFTAEDTDALGEATINAMRKVTAKATEAATKPLQEQLERERAAREADSNNRAADNRQQAYNIFISRVAKAVPDWEKINYDPEFATFLSGPDVDGTPRKTYFTAAETQGNAAQIIRYMSEFITNKPVLKDKLASKVTPVGDGAGATQAKQPGKIDVISRAFIDKFYDDLNRGRYKGRHTEALEIEARIDAAAMVEGGIQ